MTDPDTRSAGPAHDPTYDPAGSVVRVRDLHRSFTPTGGVLTGVDLDLRTGEVVGLLGRRGSGKSTLLRALARVDREVTGSGTLRLPESIATLNDTPGLLGWRRVLDNVANTLGSYDALSRSRRALAAVGLADRELAWPDDLDEGERHRVALARAIASEPELILADEPYRHLDALAQRTLHRLLRTVGRQAAILFVTNDIHEALTLTDRVVTLHEGRIHGALTVRSPGGEAPRGEEYADQHTFLLAELGLASTAPLPPRDRHTDPRRETA